MSTTAHLPPPGADVEIRPCGCRGFVVYAGTSAGGDHAHVKVTAPCPGGPPHLAAAGSGSATVGVIEHINAAAVHVLPQPEAFLVAEPHPIGAAA